MQIIMQIIIITKDDYEKRIDIEQVFVTVDRKIVILK